MRFRTAVSLASLFLTLFTIAVWTQPASSQPPLTLARSTPTNQTVAGRISSVGDASFAVEVKKNQDVQSLEFMVDENTKVEGKLEIGANATVEYSSVEGKNLAVRVIVQQTSGH
jgi:hypothetical protein